MLAVAWAGFALVVGLLALGWVRRREACRSAAARKAGTALIVLFIYSDIFVIKSTAAPDSKSTQRRIQIFGYRFGAGGR